ncbi:peptidylprolyl isomerase [Phenylobacterium sp.]|uniref:peptidylprolyl isomerase n=1 Tax=Phenylobacterium sp. TaxID=1871053 RepID=UPI002C5C396C|nr:peptidylprolyl isomerase [Phenylobacterium sp.]HLZ75385.1 peptidylprolyl isomerase [Phenylobacterium sp.]
MKFTVLALALLAAPAFASPAPTPPVADVLAAAPASDWRPIIQERLLYLQTPRGQVLIEMAPDFAPNHVDNIKRLIAAGFFDHVALVRAQDNFVVQWGVPDKDPKPSSGSALSKMPGEFTRSAKGLAFTALPDPDSYAPQTGFADGFPAARDLKTGRAWLTHCYGTVAIARDNAPDTGNGAELYAVIGSARRLDRNLTVVGRVVKGMEILAVTPRGDGPNGFLKAADIAPARMRLGSDLPAAEQVSLQALRTDSATFTKVIEGRRTRRDAFYAAPPGGADVCSVPLPVRPKP